MTIQARTFTRNARSVGRARDFVASLVGTADRAEDIRVCVSELATNALRHTPAGRVFLVHVDVRPEEHLVQIEVHDAGDGKPHVCTPADTDDRGRGLLLVAALADDWGTSERNGPGKAIWATFKLPGGPSAHQPCALSAGDRRTDRN
ncbi:ATP-binding protein [Streptomyces sp. WMMC500]|uniref:ATP-binding protein n=1 Tax=Streptomyces sp. WMMC500 TaxID=3015154 RepID=UPI00248D02C7|nr:ATP-binding protein [Streptomyces sp. WMMC500]WBB57801.1 ATP-binding protein [Streptomyces sp. WMMC500]